LLRPVVPDLEDVLQDAGLLDSVSD
jgi:hypothetical protein